MKRVLVVDDAAFMRMSIKTILQKYNFQVVGEAENGVEAVKKYKELFPDIVTMDITMPEMDGILALKEIMSIDPNSKVIMISAMGQELLVREAVKLGAKDFIVKPFQENRIVQTLLKL